MRIAKSSFNRWNISSKYWGEKWKNYDNNENVKFIEEFSKELKEELLEIRDE